MNLPATILLIRHGTNPRVGKGLTGWLPGVSLDENGRRQAECLARNLAELPIAAIYSSPLERTLETAEPLARRKGLEVIRDRAFGEIDFGDWQGKEFPEIERDPRWAKFNSFRSGIRAPGGETMLDAQARMVGRLFALAPEYEGRNVAVFSHADAIKATVSYLLGIPLDFHQRLEILPASVTTVVIDDSMPVVRSVNVTFS
jgi:probable phosphomutase (TIGR03848 family)